MRHRMAKLVICNTMVSLTILVGPAPAQNAGASSACSSTLNYQVGSENESTSYYGARGYLEYNPLSVCSALPRSDQASSVWTMVAATELADPLNYAYTQVGYVKTTPGASPEVFTQYVEQCSWQPPCPVGDNGLKTKYVSFTFTQSWAYAYTVKYDPVSTNLQMYANGTYISQMNYSPFGNWDSSWELFFAGEVDNLGSDIAGTAADSTQLDPLQYQDSSGAFVDIASPGLFTSNYNARYHRSYYTNGSGQHGASIWTDPP